MWIWSMKSWWIQKVYGIFLLQCSVQHKEFIFFYKEWKTNMITGVYYSFGNKYNFLCTMYLFPWKIRIYFWGTFFHDWTLFVELITNKTRKWVEKKFIWKKSQSMNFHDAKNTCKVPKNNNVYVHVSCINNININIYEIGIRKGRLTSTEW